MNKISMSLVTFTVGLLAMPMSADADTHYDIQTITYPGNLYTEFWGVNTRGDVSGNAYTGSECLPFIYSLKSDRFTDVTPVDGYECTTVQGISYSGLLAGTVYTFTSQSGVILDKKGDAIIVDHPDATYGTSLRAINNDGIVTGTFGPGEEDEILRAFIYDPVTDTFTDIVPSYLTIAQGIDEDGYVVGSARFASSDFIPGAVPDPCGGNEDLVEHGWLRAPDGTVTYFDVNGWRTRARGITESGTITGHVVNPNTDSVESFVTKLDGTQCQSITIPESELLAIPGVLVNAQGIDNKGQVVGIDISNGQGFIATPE